MAKGKKRKGLNKGDIEVYRHETDKRKNAVPVGLASCDTVKRDLRLKIRLEIGNFK